MPVPSGWEEPFVEVTLQKLHEETPGSIYQVFNPRTPRGRKEVEGRVREIWAWLSPTSEEMTAITKKVLDHLRDNTMSIERPRRRGRDGLYRGEDGRCVSQKVLPHGD